jgi:hypothetical protein
MLSRQNTKGVDGRSTHKPTQADAPHERNSVLQPAARQHEGEAAGFKTWPVKIEQNRCVSIPN